MNKLEIFRCRIPAVEQDGLCLNTFFFKGLAKHIPEVVVLGLAIVVRSIHTEIDGMVVFLRGMNQINNPDSFHQAMGVSTILTFHHFNFLGIAFILNAVIHN